MTAEAVTCPACRRRLRMREGREYCPHCEQRLPAASEAQPGEPEEGRRRPRPAGLAAAGVLMAMLVALGARGWRDNPVPAAPMAATVEPAAPAPEPAPVASETITAAADPVETARPFLDPGHAGNLAYQGGDYEEALRYYEDAIARNPNDAESHSNLGQVLVRFDRVEEAVRHFERAIELIPDRWAYHFNLAYALGKLGWWGRAVSEYQVAARIFPDDYVTQYNLGRAFRESGDEQAAAAAYRRAIELASEEPTFQLALARSYDRLGRVDDARASYARYLEMAPDGASAEAVRSRLSRLESSGTPREDAPRAQAVPPAN